MDKDIIHNINPTERVVRLAFSITLAFIPLVVDAPLGDIALLPLLAIYPGLTAAIGWCPLHAVAAMFQRENRETDRDDPGVKSPVVDDHALIGHA